MRVYFPATSRLLAQLETERAVPSGTAFAVTPGLREWYAEGDEEELEFAATTEAARACLRLLDADPSAARRRVVLAAELPESAVAVRDDLDRGVVSVGQPLGIADVQAVLVDDRDAEPTVRRAAELIVRADLGDPEADDAVDDAEGFDLSWYATQEIPELLRDLHPEDSAPSGTAS